MTQGSSRVSRRQFLATSAAAAAVGLAGCGSDDQTRYGWNVVETPTRKGLTDAAMTTDGPYAVGESGLVLTRRGDEWQTVVQNGPDGSNNGLSGMDVTDDGKKLWVCGSSGALGRYDVVAGEMTDFTAPRQKTSSWADVAVDGRSGSELVYLVNGSGELLPGRWSGQRMNWAEVTKPTGGESAAAVDTASGVVYVTDTGGGVYRHEEKSEDGWTAAGIRGVDASLRDVAAVDGDLVDVAADDGSIYVYNGYNWLQLRAGEHPLHGIDRDRHRGLAVGNNGSAHAIQENNWQTESTPTTKTLQGCALGNASHSDVAVGNDGTILERFG
ncbi:twin-arginine translocation signal domain-containing protein [Halobacteria archaeon HArc-gm2]|nr:twin-arginine translocation signal domain-containing protein [Halobacteria archaeon HArc-gm2]